MPNDVVPAELAEQRVLVVDLQATGASPSHGSTLELGWLLTHAEEEEAPEPTCHLVAQPEGARIPRPVARITGIRDADLESASSEAEAWTALVDLATKAATTGEPTLPRRGVQLSLLGPPPPTTPTVIHYARFEEAFFADLSARLTPGRALPFDIVCTHAIARRVLPTLPRRSLRALAGYYGFNVELMRRAQGHVAATAFVWRHLVAALAERGIRSWDELRSWLDETRAPTSKRVYPMDRDKRLALPDRPGIYKMLRSNGDVLYLGKATSLKKRVNSYFRKRKGVNERSLEMLTQARDLEVEETATALEAALLETDAIKQHRPPYNVALREDEREVWFAARDLSDAVPEPDADHPFGPLPSRRSLTSLAAIRDELAEPGQGRKGERRAARALAAPLPLSPDEATFQAGMAQFRERWLEQGDPLRVVMAATKLLWRRYLSGDLKLDSDPDEEDKSWDPDRVARHLTRVVVFGGQLMRRARWLCLLSDAAVAWSEPTGPEEGRRLLVFEGGELVEQGFLEARAPLPPRARRQRHEVQASFDIARYDRLRVVTTELKRVMGQTGAVSVGLPGGQVLFGIQLAQTLDWV